MEEEGILDCSMIELVSSPSSSTANESSETQEEEEVFFGPVKLQERIAAYNVRTATEDDATPRPLNDRQWAELHKEANRLIKRMEKSVAPSDGVTPLKPKNNLLHLDSKLFDKKLEMKNLQKMSKKDQENNPSKDRLDISLGKVETLHTETLNTVCDRSPLVPIQTNIKNNHSPTKRHNRSFTYTLDKSSLELLPGELTESLPHIDDDGKGDRTSNTSKGVLTDLGLDNSDTFKSLEKHEGDDKSQGFKSQISKDLLIELDNEGLHNEDTLKNGFKNTECVLDTDQENLKTGAHGICNHNNSVKIVAERDCSLLVDFECDNETKNNDHSSTNGVQDEISENVENAGHYHKVRKDEMMETDKPDDATDLMMTDKCTSNINDVGEPDMENKPEIDKNMKVSNEVAKDGLNTSTAEKNDNKDIRKAGDRDDKTAMGKGTLKVGESKVEVAGNGKPKSKPSGLSRLRPPSFRTKDKSSVPALQKLQKTQIPAQPTDPSTQEQPKIKSSELQPKNQPSSTNQGTSIHPKSRLSIPQQKAPLKKSPLEQSQPAAKSRLSFPKTETSSTTSKLQKPSTAGPVKPSAGKNTGAVNPSKAAPTSKLQMLRPSGLQRPSVNTKPGDNLKKTGPMKAFKPTTANSSSKQNIEQAAANQITPAKVEKTVKRTNLAASFASPKPSKKNSVDSPSGSATKRRSVLPTPNKSRLNAVGSISSPCSTRTSSTSSNKSLPSPLITGSASKRRASVARNGEKKERPPLPKGRRSMPAPYSRKWHQKLYMSSSTHLNLDQSKFLSSGDGLCKNGPGFEFNDRSPSSMMSKKALVVNTPNLPKKKEISPWSPIQKKRPLDQLEEVTRCTKIKK